jgi:hypothetical protein
VGVWALKIAAVKQLASLDVSPRPVRHNRVGLSCKPLGRELLFDEVEDPGVHGSPIGSVRVDQVHAVGEAVALQQDVRLPSHRLVQPPLLPLTLGGEIVLCPDVQRGAGDFPSIGQDIAVVLDGAFARQTDDPGQVGRTVAAASITTRPPSDAPINA